MHPPKGLLEKTHARMGPIDTPNQILGRTQTIGCVAVEITQKCNLDCTLCYLSEHSQQVSDIPLEEVYRRLDQVLEEFGPGTHVQITGGDPTLRKHKELVEIVRYTRSLGLYPALFTNGIGATRKLLTALADAGLADVAFHVDTTQERAGYDTEVSLHEIRREYLERARGLGLMVIFNTTVHLGNREEVPDLIDFFIQHAEEIGLVSFNLQAETGRGVWGSREEAFNHHSLRAPLEEAAGRELPWDTVRVGHHGCHSYLPLLVVNGKLHVALDDERLVAELLKVAPTISTDRHRSRFAIFWRYFAIALKTPSLWMPGISYFGRRIRQMLPDVIRARGKVHKLTFFMQNFMDAGELDQERIDACSFMVMTADGPVSMCEHNASRDDYILKPLDVVTADGTVKRYEPLPLRVEVEPAHESVVA